MEIISKAMMDKGFDISGFTGPDLFIRLTAGAVKLVDAMLPHCRERRRAIQAGGCLGVVPAYMALHFESVVTFEPSEDNFRHMCSNISDGRVEKIHAALGNVQGWVDISAPRKMKPDGEIIDISSWKVVDGWKPKPAAVVSERPMPMMRLDDLLLGPVDALMLDVEGYELPALMGARELLARDHPVVAVEVNGVAEKYFGRTASETGVFLESLGYEMVEDMIDNRIYAFPSPVVLLSAHARGAL